MKRKPWEVSSDEWQITWRLWCGQPVALPWTGTGSVPWRRVIHSVLVPLLHKEETAKGYEAPAVNNLQLHVGSNLNINLTSPSNKP